jgi:hypothetical protein
VVFSGRLPVELAREEADRWHLCNAFRDAVDATGLFLDGVRAVAAEARAAQNKTLTGVP